MQRPHPPLYLGAFTEAGLRRIARRADGWLTVLLPPDVIASTSANVKELTADAGRDPDAMQLIVRANASVTATRTTAGPAPFVGTVDQIAEEIARYADLDTHELHLDLQFSPGVDTPDTLIDTAERIHARVRALQDGRPSALVTAHT